MFCSAHSTSHQLVIRELFEIIFPFCTLLWYYYTLSFTFSISFWLSLDPFHSLYLFLSHTLFFTLSLHFFSLQIVHYAVIFEENSKPHQIFCQHFSVKLTFSIILIHSCNFSTIPVHVALLFSIPSHQLLGCFVEYFIVTEMVCDNNFHFRQTTSNELEMEFFFIHIAGWLMSTDTKGWKLMFVEYIYLWPLVVCIHFNIDTQSLFYTQFICIARKKIHSHFMHFIL